jgi:1-acyl-sn-glycerol-3-phosphate acyltransferase
MERSFAKRLWYDFLRVAARALGTVCYRIRVRGRENWPATGGGLVLCNHQSHFDPPLVGLTCERRLNYLARDTLFKFFLFRWLIESLDAIPVDREGLGLAGLKETLRRLKRGEFVLVFPEGTRTPDGEVHELKPGFSALATRSGVPIIPVAIDGAFQIWPRKQLLPSPYGVLHLTIGQPISPAELAERSDREIVAMMQERLQALHAQTRAWRRRACGR